MSFKKQRIMNLRILDEGNFDKMIQSEALLKIIYQNCIELILIDE